MIVNKINFATTNEGKLKEARELLNIDVVGTGLDIDEIQSIDSVVVATQKANSYYAKLQKPVLVEDVSSSFAHLKGLPGAYINDFSKALDNEGLINLLKGSRVRKAEAMTVLVFIDKNKTEIFKGVVKGEIAKKPKGKNGFGWDPIFIPSGSNKTFAQMSDSEKHKYSMRAKAFKKFKRWLSAPGSDNRDRTK